MARIALTREDGLNDQLETAIRHSYMKNVSVFDEGLQFEEIPAVEHVRGPDFARLGRLWDRDEFDCVCVIGAEAARIYADHCSIEFAK